MSIGFVDKKDLIQNIAGTKYNSIGWFGILMNELSIPEGEKFLWFNEIGIYSNL